METMFGMGFSDSIFKWANAMLLMATGLLTEDRNFFKWVNAMLLMATGLLTEDRNF